MPHSKRVKVLHFFTMPLRVTHPYGRQLLSLFLILAGLLLVIGPTSNVSKAANPESLPPSVSSDWESVVQSDLSQREYQVIWQEQPDLPGLTAAYQAPNRVQNLRAYFTPQGLTLIPRTLDSNSQISLSPRMGSRLEGNGYLPAQPSGEAAESWQLSLSLTAYGYGDQSQALPEPTLTAAANGVTYDYGLLTEWYRNDETGLKHGFTLKRPPTHSTSAGQAAEHRPQPLVLELTLQTDLTPTLNADGQSLTLTAAAGQTRLTYDRLQVYDAAGQPLSARFTVDDLRQLTTAESKIVNPKSKIVNILIEAASARFPLTIDPLFSTPPTANTTLEINQASANLGTGVAGAGDVNGDGYDDIVVGAPSYDNGQTDEGAAFIYHGSAAGLSTTPAAIVESNQVYTGLGVSVAGAGDVNGDGYADVIVGAQGYDNGQTDEGAAFIYHGSAAGLSTTPAAIVESNQAAAGLGVSVAGAGDINGDGYADVIIGALYYVNGQAQEGAAFVYHGSSVGLSTTPATVVESNQAYARLGFSVAGAGDVNGDGYADVIVGVIFYDNGQTDEGAAFVYHGSAAGLSTTPAAIVESNQAAAGLGFSVAGAGDVNGDGYADVIVGAYYYVNGQGEEGAAFVYHGSAVGLSTTPATVVESNQVYARLGFSVAGAGDVNGDGYADVIVGANQYDNGQTDEGAAWVYHGSAVGLSTTPAVILESNQAHAYFGEVAGAGDVNGDGYADVIVGANQYDNGQTDEGAAWVYHGSAMGVNTTPATTLKSNQSLANMGYGVAGVGDVNGDGYADVIVGAYDYTNGQPEEGAVFVYHGSAVGLSATPAAILECNQASASFGSTVAGAGDINGDGYADIIVGSWGCGTFVYHGSVSGVSSTPAVTLSYQANSVAGAGDVNGDGFADILIGDSGYDNGQTDEGAVWIYHGAASGLSATPAVILESNQTNARLGESVAGAGDVNGDGFADIIVAVPDYTNGQLYDGAAFIYHGSTAGIVGATPAVILRNYQDYAEFGSSVLGKGVAGAGDVNGDGFADVIVQFSDTSNGYNYTAHIYRGSIDGVDDLPRWTLMDYYLSPTESVAGAGDVNGDGYGDVIVGTYNDKIYIYHGGSDGISIFPDVTINCSESDCNYSDMDYNVAGAGDVNGDGYADVIVGMDNYAGEGAALLYLGNRAGRPVLSQQRRSDGSMPAPAWGMAYDNGQFQVRLRLTSPAGRERVKLQVQACPAGQPFGGAGCVNQVSFTWTDVTATSGGVTLTETVGGLNANTLYHWRARALYAPFRVTAAGITAPPNPAHGPWRRFNGQAVEADVRVATDNTDFQTSLDSLTFTTIAGGGNPADQSVSISNTGAGTLVWTAVVSGVGWLSASPAAGSGDGAVNVSVNNAGLSEGSYWGEVTILAGNMGQSIPVLLEVKSSVSPVLEINPSSLAFTAAADGSNPSDLTLTLGNGGGQYLDWTAFASSEGWLSVSPADGSEEGEITVSANIAGLAEGTYNGEVMVQATGATNTPQNIPVTLTIEPNRPGLPTSEIRLTEANDGQTVAVTEGQYVTIELEVNPSSGYGWQVQPEGAGQDATGQPIFRLSDQVESISLGDEAGSSVKQIIRFDPLQAGQAALKLGYLGPEATTPERVISIQLQSSGVYSDEVQSAAPPTVDDTPAPFIDPEEQLEIQGQVNSQATPPAEFNWRDQNKTTPAKNQNPCGNCWAFAAAGMFESKILIEGGETRDLSEQYLVSCRSTPAPGTCKNDDPKKNTSITFDY